MMLFNLNYGAVLRKKKLVMSIKNQNEHQKFYFKLHKSGTSLRNVTLTGVFPCMIEYIPEIILKELNCNQVILRVTTKS